MPLPNATTVTPPPVTPQNPLYAKPGEDYNAYEARQGFPQTTKPPDIMAITPNQNNGSISPTTAQQNANQTPTPQANNAVGGQAINPDGSKNPYASTSTTDTSSTTLPDQADQDALTQANNDFQNEATNVQNTITNIQNGSTPLNAGEQAQVDGLKQQFQALVDFQKLVNAGATGTANIRGYQAGSAEYDPTFQVKTVGAVVSAGQQKIADLQIKEASAIALLTQSFRDNDTKLAQSAWATYTEAYKAKTASLQQTIAATTAAIKNAQDLTQKAKDDSYKAVQDAILNQRADVAAGLAQDNFDAKQAQDELDNAYRNKQLDEKTYYDAQDLILKKATLALQQGTSNLSNQNLPTVKMTASDVPNPADQAAFLEQFPQDLQTTIKAIANYDQNPSSISTRQYKGVGSPNQMQILSWVKQYDPTYSESQYANRQALIKNFQSGTYSKNINALNTAVGHLNDLVDNFAKLDNSGFTPYNAAKNSINQMFGSGGVTRASTNINASVGELASTFKSSGATDTEIKSLGTVDPNSSPDQIKAFIETGVQLMASRLQALEDTYTSGMGKAPTKGFLSPQNQDALLKLQGLGYDIKVPELADNPVVKLSTFGSSSPQNQQILDKLNSDPQLQNANPQDIVDYLESKGYLQ